MKAIKECFAGADTVEYWERAALAHRTFAAATIFATMRDDHLEAARYCEQRAEENRNKGERSS